MYNNGKHTHTNRMLGISLAETFVWLSGLSQSLQTLNASNRQLLRRMIFRIFDFRVINICCHYDYHHPRAINYFRFSCQLAGCFRCTFYHRRQFCIHSSDRTLSRTLPLHFRFLCHCKRDCDEWREPPMMANEEQSEQWLNDISVFSFLAGYV